MVKKMNLPFLFMKSTETTTPSWQWPTCATPKTLSFRASGQNHVLKTINDTALDLSSSPSLSSSAMGNSEEATLLEGEDSLEKVVIRGLRSERLVFEPGETSSSSILDPQEVKNIDDNDDDDNNDNDNDDGGGLIGRFKENVVMAVLDSTDPFVDFRRSMQEMVEAHQGLNKDWECLEELLTCYLRVNGKSNHGYIVGAFVDLLVGLALSSSSSSSSSSDHDQYCHCYCSSSSSSSYSSSSCTNTNSFTSPLSFSSYTTCSTISPCLSILEVDDEIQKSIDHNNISSSSSSSSSSNICSI